MCIYVCESKGNVDISYMMDILLTSSIPPQNAPRSPPRPKKCSFFGLFFVRPIEKKNANFFPPAPGQSRGVLGDEKKNVSVAYMHVKDVIVT
jgi:hypothetical protein